MTAIQAETEPSSQDDALETVQKLPLVEIGRRVFKEFKDDAVPDVAAGVAYHAVFAIPPMIIFVITLAALFGQVTSVDVADRLRDLIAERAPEDTQDLLTSLVDSAIADVSGGVASFGVALSAIIALWSGSNGIATITRAFNRAYDVKEDRSFIKQKIVTIGLTVLMGVVAILAFTMFVFGEQLGSWAAEQMGLGSAFELTWNIARWPLAIVFIMSMMTMLYYLGPNVKQSFQWISPGSIIATLLWIAVIFGFKIYVTYANPGSAYGAVGSIIVLLVFLYLSSIVFLVGAEVNAVMQRRYDEETIEDLSEHPEKATDNDARATNRQNARDLEKRERKAVTTSTEPDAKRPTRPTKPGVGQRIGALIGSSILALVSAKLRRGKKDDKPQHTDR